jgi:hypothetical protein
MFKSKHKGIGYKNGPGRQKRWVARIMVNGKYNNIGHYMTEEEAVTAYENFIEENKDNLPKRAKNLTKNIEDMPRNSDGMIERTCLDCGKIDYFEKVPLHERCGSCGKKERFRHQPAVGLKELDLESAYKDYQSGISLEETGKKYGFSAGGLERKFKRHGYDTRNHSETSILNNKKYGNIYKAQEKIKELCKTGEFQKKMSSLRQGIPTEEWTHFTTPENLQYYKSEEFKIWRNEVLDRDGYICQKCNQKKSELHAHHIKPKAKFWELRTDINNGITLCRDCHFSLNGKEHEYEQLFLDILKSKGLPLQESV